MRMNRALDLLKRSAHLAVRFPHKQTPGWRACHERFELQQVGKAGGPLRCVVLQPLDEVGHLADEYRT